MDNDDNAWSVSLFESAQIALRYEKQGKNNQEREDGNYGAARIPPVAGESQGNVGSNRLISPHGTVPLRPPMHPAIPARRRISTATNICLWTTQLGLD